MKRVVKIVVVILLITVTLISATWIYKKYEEQNYIFGTRYHSTLFLICRYRKK